MGKRFVSIWLPHLATDWVAFFKPHLKDLPFVLTASDHGRIVVAAANLAAKCEGICPGMALADARAIVPGLLKMEDKPERIPKLLNLIAEWCIRFSPVAAIDLPDGILLDASGCSHLWGGDENYVDDIVKKFGTKGFHAKVAMADTVGAAWAVARFGNVTVVEGKAGLFNLPPEALRLDHEVVERLHKLGLRQIKELISMPRTALSRRFGSSILQRLSQALGTEEEFIQPVCPLLPYQERLPCLEPIVNRGGIEIALQNLLKQICERLRKEGKGLREAVFKGYRIDNKIEAIQITTTGPSHNEDHLFHLFEIKLGTMEAGMGIELFVLEAFKVEDKEAAQTELWKGKDEGKLAELMDRLAVKLGLNAIHRYLPAEHYWPERSFVKAGSLQEQADTRWRTNRPRPLQLLAVPEPIEVTAPIPDYPPMLFRYKGKLHTIKKADGPERIEQEWWIGDGLHRDYYAVEDEQGCRYWLFRSGHYDEKNFQWFIHGYFS